MQRRWFIGLVGGAAVWPLAAEIVQAAESNKVYRVAAVSPVSASDSRGGNTHSK
jgi:hypothetical protein